ncbi:MAG TPA: 50S ribosomal protein L24, partial [Candidatus Nanoarchaeia archaeon]|nr:50S ribosomal protein L24 [Candidatus Nanoarchaeia archaeon]
SSKNPKKQRKYRYEAPLHLRRKLMRIHLLGDLAKKHSIRNISVRKGDKIKVIKGDFKKLEGKVDRVDLKDYKIYVEGIERAKKDGTKALIPLAPANVILIELDLEDKRRLKTPQKEAPKGGKK